MTDLGPAHVRPPGILLPVSRTAHTSAGQHPSGEGRVALERLRRRAAG